MDFTKSVFLENSDQGLKIIVPDDRINERKEA
jgi:hypothetical protein